MRFETLTVALGRRYAFIPAALSAVLFSTVAEAVDIPAPPVNLAWNANPETNIAGYKVHFGTSSGSYSQIIDVPGQTHVELPQLILGGTYYLAVSAYNTDGLEGPLSTEMRLSAAPPAPAEETSFTMSGPGSGKLAWKHPKGGGEGTVAGGPAEGFAIYGSEDLVTWNLVQNIGPEDAAASDAEFLYFEWPYAATKQKMFFKIAAGNAFGESK